jgi:hypothetical protein
LQRREGNQIWCVQVRSVDQIKYLGAELEREPFIQRDCLDVMRATQEDAAEAAKSGSESPLGEPMPKCQFRDFSNFKLDVVGDLSNPFAL